MIGRRALKLLWDARDAGESLRDFLAGKTYEDYPASDLLRLAVERQFITMGEALAALRRADPETARRVPDLAAIVAFRNILVHDYNDIESEKVWAVAHERLPVLLETLSRLLQEGGPEPG